MSQVPIKTTLADEILAKADQQERIDAAKRREMMKTVAQMRWKLATEIHETEDGSKMNFERFPFQKEIYQSTAEDLVVFGGTGWGKTLFAIIDDFAKALCGLRVIHVCDKAQKRNSFVLGIVDPLIHRIPFYAAMLEGAAKDRKAEVDSAYQKHFGDGMMYFLGANSESDFYSYRGDSTMVDEMQLCDLDNLAKLFGRRTGSFYRFQTVMGNPKEFGSAQNQNIHWQFLESDQRQWKIPCPHCHEYQRLSWGTHFVKERTNDFGAIVEVEILDKERADQEELEIRPICQFCGFPMWRLHPEGKWVVTNPGKRRHGYQLSNLYNPEVSTLELLGEYRKGFHNPGLKASFHQNQLGEPYAASGANITEEMLEQACTGLNSGVMPYAFIDVSDLEFHDVDVQT